MMINDVAVQCVSSAPVGSLSSNSDRSVAAKVKRRYSWLDVAPWWQGWWVKKTQARHLYFQIRCWKVPSCRSAALKLAQPLRNLEAWISCWIWMRYTNNCIAFVALCGMLHMFMLMCKMSWHPARTTGSSKILPSSNSDRHTVNNEMDHDRFHRNEFCSHVAEWGLEESGKRISTTSCSAKKLPEEEIRGVSRWRYAKTFA